MWRQTLHAHARRGRPRRRRAGRLRRRARQVLPLSPLRRQLHHAHPRHPRPRHRRQAQRAIAIDRGAPSASGRAQGFAGNWPLLAATELLLGPLAPIAAPTAGGDVPAVGAARRGGASLRRAADRGRARPPAARRRARLARRAPRSSSPARCSRSCCSCICARARIVAGAAARAHRPRSSGRWRSLSTFPELTRNELLFSFWPTDLALPWLGRRYLNARLVVLGARDRAAPRTSSCSRSPRRSCRSFRWQSHAGSSGVEPEACGTCASAVRFHRRHRRLRARGSTSSRCSRRSTIRRARRRSSAGASPCRPPRVHAQGVAAITHQSTSSTYRRLRRPLDDRARAEAGAFRDNATVDGAWRTTLRCARLLGATAILFQCPASFRATDENVANLRRFFQRIGPTDGVRYLWEPRGPWPDALVAELCRELALTHVVDPIRPSDGDERPHLLSIARHRPARAMSTRTRSSTRSGAWCRRRGRPT